MKKLLYTTILLLAMGLVKAQDIHFSQFYSSPLTLNPALTGLMDGNFRVGAIYRNQWNSVSAPFTTISGYADVPITKGMKNGDVVGVGLMLFNDKTGTVGLNNFTGVVSVAYHKALGVNRSHVLSFGVQIGITQRKLDISKAIFADQADNTLSAVNSSADAANYSGKLHEEFNAGLGYSAKFGKRSKVFVGGTVFHITQPVESLLKTSDSKLPLRFVGHASADIGLGKVISLLPSVIYMNQANDQELNLGTGIGFSFKPDIRAILGVYYRLSDAIIPMIGLDIKGLNLGFSYDVTLSSLQTSTSNKGGFEVSLFYIMPYKKLPQVNSVIYNPRF